MSQQYNKARQAIQIEHAAHQQATLERQINHNENLRENFNKQYVGGELNDKPGEEMAVNVDSPMTINNHYEQTKEKKKSKLVTIGNLALGAALIGSGAGILPGIKMIIDGIKPTPAPVVIEKKTTEKPDRRYILDLGDPKD